MKRRTKGKTALPRLTVLAYSRLELQRFSAAAESVAAAARDLVYLVGVLSAQVDRLEKRSGAAKKANQTRRQGNSPPAPPMSNNA